MKTKEKINKVSLNVEWRDNDLSNALAAMLLRSGAKDVRIYECPNMDDYEASYYDHKHTEFTVCSGDDYPAWRILTDIASHPGVLSVGEAEGRGFIERIIRSLFK